jgi:hypothetical protein
VRGMSEKPDFFSKHQDSIGASPILERGREHGTAAPSRVVLSQMVTVLQGTSDFQLLKRLHGCYLSRVMPHTELEMSWTRIPAKCM